MESVPHEHTVDDLVHLCIINTLNENIFIEPGNGLVKVRANCISVN